MESSGSDGLVLVDMDTMIPSVLEPTTVERQIVTEEWREEYRGTRPIHLDLKHP